MQTNLFDLLRRSQVYLKQAALKKGSSIEYVSENRIFNDADDYSMEIELPLADCPQNLTDYAKVINPSENLPQEIKELRIL